ncbi:MAG: hypothetical protein AAFQ85_08915 [Pseudomonadota bacterium]
MEAKVPVLAVALGAVLAPVALAQSAAQGTAEDFDSAHSAVMNDPSMQTERPILDAPEPPEPRESIGWLAAIFDGIAGFLGALGPIVQVLVYGGIAALVGTIVYMIFGEAIRARFKPRDKDGDPKEDVVIEDIRPDAAAARSLLEEADALAKQGRFAEAAHLLLFRSIEDIQIKRGERVPQALTAREIGTLPTLPDRARTALSPIIAVVERSFFGGRTVDETGWVTARRSYEDFAFGGAWR